MTKLQRMLTSLVAVIPAAFVMYLLVMAMISHTGNLSTMAFVVMGTTLIALLVTVLIPAGIMMGGKSKAAATPAVVSTGSGESGEDLEALDDDEEGSISAASSGSFDAHDVLEESSAEIDIGDSDQDLLGSESEAEIETEPVEDLDDFDIEEVEEEEVPKSKKKKK